MSMNVWKVVGGAEKGGIIVRASQDLASAERSTRLSTGARVECLQLVGNRLHYRLRSGTGPEEGWVSTSIGSKVLLSKLSIRKWDSAGDMRLHAVWVDGTPNHKDSATDLITEAGICVHRYHCVEDALLDFGKVYPDDRRLVIVAASMMPDGRMSCWQMFDWYRFMLERKRTNKCGSRVVFAMVSEDVPEAQCKDHGIDVQMKGDVFNLQTRILELTGGGRALSKLQVDGPLLLCNSFRRILDSVVPTFARNMNLRSQVVYTCHCMNCVEDPENMPSGFIRVGFESKHGGGGSPMGLVAYHGTDAENAFSIVSQGRFYLPGQMMLNGQACHARHGQAWTGIANNGLGFEEAIAHVRAAARSGARDVSAAQAQIAARLPSVGQEAAVYFTPSISYARYYSKSSSYHGLHINPVVEAMVPRSVRKFPITVPCLKLDGYNPLQAEWVVSDAAAVIPTALIVFIS